MRPHRGAWRLLHFLYKRSRVMIVTARSSTSRDWTKVWLNDHWLEYDDVETSVEARKSEHGTLVLIDDYLGNIIEFLNHTRGVAILVDQPWNRDRGELEPFVVAGRAFVVKRLIEVRSIWPGVVAQLRSVDQPQMQARA